MRPGVKLDFRAKPDGHVVSAAEVQREFDRIGYQLQPFDIVLVNTSAGAAYGSADFLNKGCGMGAEATLFLTGQGVRGVGTDAWSWDSTAGGGVGEECGRRCRSWWTARHE